MGARIDLTGQRFGKLVVLAIVSSIKGVVSWDCICDCGNRFTATTASLRYSGRKSCGCIHREQLIARNTTHGLRAHRVYRVWAAMRDRCNRPADKFYADYGGRGIKVCDSWQTFENFIADMGVPADGMQIDRINNDGDYEPSNCQWVTRTENASNKRNNKVIEYHGKSKTVSAWEKELGFKPGTIKQRLYLGWSIERAIEKR